jgi:hypothetical protein
MIRWRWQTASRALAHRGLCLRKGCWDLGAFCLVAAGGEMVHALDHRKPVLNAKTGRMLAERTVRFEVEAFRDSMKKRHSRITGMPPKG